MLPDELPERPPFLFKYRSINDFLRGLLVDHVLWASSFSDFNDPFDCAPVVSSQATDRQLQSWLLLLSRSENPKLGRRAARGHRASLRKQRAFSRRDLGTPRLTELLRTEMLAQIERAGMICLSADPSNILMWSHYADNHKGVVLVFHGPALEAYEIQYARERPVVNPITRNSTMIDEAIFRKADFWAYEQEWRILTPRHTGALGFPPNWLRGIILGARTSPDDEARVRLWAKEGRLNLTWKRAELDPSEFRMNIVDA